MIRHDWRRWQVTIPAATVVVTVVLYVLLLPKQIFIPSWSNGDLKASAGELHIEYGHGPVAHPMKQLNDFTLRLHPGDHTQRPAQTITYAWSITKGQRRPDGVAKTVYLVNGDFPGPTIEARSGDNLQITIHNDIEEDEEIAIHWHGLRVSNLMDGAAGLTQCAVRYNQSFTYQLQVQDDNDGTFWWHSHFETQRADGLFGALVVHKPAESVAADESALFDYEQDHVLMINDWYHRTAPEVLEDYTDWKNFKVEPAPDSLLLNGQGYFECSKAMPARPLDCEKVAVPHLTLPAGRSRLRIVNTGAMTGLSVSLTGFAVTLIKVDGGSDVKLISARGMVGILYPGERVDIIAERADTAGEESPSMTVALDRENMGFPNLALEPIQQFPVLSPPGGNTGGDVASKDGLEANHQSEGLDLRSVSGKELPSGTMPEMAEQTVLLYTTISYLAEYENRPKAFINRTSWEPSDSQPLPLIAMNRTDWPTDPAPFVVPVENARWMDIVVNNLDDKGHPFHLHGHDFYVLSRHKPVRVGAYDAFNPFDQSKEPAGGPMNLNDPVRRDTVYIPSMGYVVLRVRMDNPGIWPFHCHVLWHQSVGMAMALQVGRETDAASDMAESARQTCAALTGDG